MTGVAAMLRYEMADQIEDELSGSDDGDLSSDDEEEVREETETEKEDDSDASSQPMKGGLGDNSEEAKSSQKDSDYAYADMDDLDPFGQFDGVENDDDLGVDELALLGIKSNDKISKKSNSAQLGE